MNKKYYYSTVTKRFYAFIIDQIIFLPLYYLSFRLVFKDFENFYSTPNFSNGLPSFIPLIQLASVMVYFSNYILLTYFFGGTIGKIILGIKVISSKTSNLTFGQILLRETLGKAISGAFFFAGYISAISDSRKQAWHDKFANTYVISNSPQSKESKFLYLFGALYFIIPFLVAILFVIFIFIPMGNKRTEAYRQDRDLQRINDLAKLNDLIIASQSLNPPRSLCIEGHPPCDGNSDDDSRVANIDGSGWIKIDLKNINETNLTSLPLDPRNKDDGYFYYYCSDGKNWKISSPLESKLYLEKAKNDGGNEPESYEIGSDLFVCN